MTIKTHRQLYLKVNTYDMNWSIDELRRRLKETAIIHEGMPKDLIDPMLIPEDTRKKARKRKRISVKRKLALRIADQKLNCAGPEAMLLGRTCPSAPKGESSLSLKPPEIQTGRKPTLRMQSCTSVHVHKGI